MIKFYKGDAAKYNPEEHGEGIYFTNDTSEILHNGISYSGKKDYTSSLEDKSLTTAYNVGGIMSGTKLEDLEGKTYNELFDEILFPAVNPTPTGSPEISDFVLHSDNVVKIGTGVNIISPASLDRKKWNNYNGDLPYAGEITNTKYEFIINETRYYNISDLYNKTYTTLGNHTYTATIFYEQGPDPKNNKGLVVPSLSCPAGSVSTTRTINVTVPWYATTETPGELKEQSLISWSNEMQAGAKGVGFELKPHTKDKPQQIKLPRPISKLYQLNTNSADNSAGMGAGFIEISSDTWNVVRTTEPINNIRQTYYVYTYAGEPRGSVKLIVKF